LGSHGDTDLCAFLKQPKRPVLYLMFFSTLWVVHMSLSFVQFISFWTTFPFFIHWLCWYEIWPGLNFVFQILYFRNNWSCQSHEISVLKRQVIILCCIICRSLMEFRAWFPCEDVFWTAPGRNRAQSSDHQHAQILSSLSPFLFSSNLGNFFRMRNPKPIHRFD